MQWKLTAGIPCSEENVSYLQEGLRNADFSTTLTVFGLKPRSGTTQYLAQFRLWGLFFCTEQKIALPEVIVTQVHTNHNNSLYAISKHLYSHLPQRQCSIITQLRTVLMRRLHMKPIFFLGGVISLEVGKVSLELFIYDNSMWAAKSQQDWWAQCAVIWSLQLMNLQNIYWHYCFTIIVIVLRWRKCSDALIKWKDYCRTTLHWKSLMKMS